MRNPIMLAVLLMLAACESQAEREAREEREFQMKLQAMAGRPVYEAREAGGGNARPTDPGSTDAAVGGGTAGDLAAPVASKPAGDGSCAGMGGAEGFVRCVYAGLDHGSLDLADPPTIKIVWGGTDAQLAEYKAYPADFQATLVRQQLATLCGCTSPGRGAFGVRAVRMGQPGGDKAEARVTLENGGVVTIQLKRQAGAWSFENAA